MRLAAFSKNGTEALGVIEDGNILDISELLPGPRKDVLAFMDGGTKLRDAAAKAVSGGQLASSPLAGATWLKPIAEPGKIICLGLNYAEHAREGGSSVPEYPAVFLRVNSSLTAAGAPVYKFTESDEMDFEAELLVVIGKRCSRVDELKALDHVFGYSIFNDLSMRDYQRKTTQWTMGKNFDASGPFGPVVVTADELPPGGAGLAIRSLLNGKVMQDGNTRDMVFSVARTIAIISAVMTLEPGDIIATGTPAGVGASRRPQVFLNAGDTIEVEIEQIGKLSNPVRARDGKAVGAVAAS